MCPRLMADMGISRTRKETIKVFFGRRGEIPVWARDMRKIL